MEIVIDLLLLGSLIGALVAGYRRGFVEVIAKLVKFLGSFFLAFKFSKDVSVSVFQPMLQEPITKSFSDFLTEKCGELTVGNVEQELPLMLKLIANLFDINISEIAGGASTSVSEALALSFTEPVVAFVSVIVSFFVVLLVAFVALSVVFFVINLIFSAGPLGLFNKIIGALLMMALCAIGCSLIVSVVSWICGPEFDFGGPLFQLFNTYSPLDALLF